MLELTFLIKKNHQQLSQLQPIHLLKLNSRAISHLLNQRLSNQVFPQSESLLEVQLELQQEELQLLQESDSVIRQVKTQLKQHM